MTTTGHDTLGTRSTLSVGGKDYAYYSLDKAAAKLGDVSRLPFSMKVLLENLLRFEDGGFTVSTDDVQALVDWQKDPHSNREIQYRPARVLLQDFTGVPCVVDLAAMRDAIAKLGGDTTKINPLVPVHLVIDHSVMVDEFGHPKAFEQNVEIEYYRNGERYDFLKWGSKSLDNFKAVPPGTGICHQVNLEHIAQAVWSSQDADGTTIAYPDTCVGTDSHTTMINGLGVLGWGVGGIEAEAAMLGQPVSMLIPEVVGFKLTGALKEGVTATDLVLTATQMLRAKGVVGRFVEYFGPGLSSLSLADRATLANMAPEYGATCGFFGIDDKTLDYMRLTGRSAENVALVEAYAKAQGLWLSADMADPVFTDTLELDMGTVVPSLAGPKRPQDKVILTEVDDVFNADLASVYKHDGIKRVPVAGKDHDIGDGDVVIAAITSCTNTSNPGVMVAAGLVARKANALGPEAQAVGQDLARAGIAGRHRLFRPRRADRRSRRGRLQPRRLWLHHLHRQFGAARGADFGGDQRQRHRRRVGHFGQPQLRRPRVARRARQLPRLAAAGCCLCAQGHGDRRFHHHPDRAGPVGQGRLPRRHLADQSGGRRHHRVVHRPRHVRGALRACLSRRRALAEDRGRGHRTPISGAPGRPMSPTRPISRA